MPSTFQALAVFVFAFMPGALLIWAFERQIGRWIISLTERVLRFVAVSAAIQVLASPATFAVWHDYLRDGALGEQDRLPVGLWLAAMAYVVVPIALGTGLAYAYQAKQGWTNAFVASPPAASAWDALFSEDPAGEVLMRLKSGRWIGGAYEAGSAAGGHPEPADLFLSVEYLVDQDAEDFAVDDKGDYIPLEWGVLVRWSEVEYLEVAPTEGTKARST